MRLLENDTVIHHDSSFFFFVEGLPLAKANDRVFPFPYVDSLIPQSGRLIVHAALRLNHSGTRGMKAMCRGRGTDAL